jgi:hypothetical protein
MNKYRYRQLAKVFKWNDEQLKTKAFVVLCRWLSCKKTKVIIDE